MKEAPDSSSTLNKGRGPMGMPKFAIEHWRKILLAFVVLEPIGVTVTYLGENNQLPESVQRYYNEEIGKILDGEKTNETPLSH